MATLKEQQQSSVQIKLDRTDRIYRQGDVVKGCVVVNSPMKQLSHTGIKLKINGVCTLQLSARTVGLFEAFYSSLKPQTLMSYEIDIASGGKLPRGETELPFEFPLEPMVGKELFETYHGVYITIAYTIVCDCTRSAFSRQLQKELEFIVEVPSASEYETTRQDFDISPVSLENVRKSTIESLPPFRVTGHIRSNNCAISQPFIGELKVMEAPVPIRSVSLQLVRVETVTFSEGEAREATEIQNIQIADGDVCRDFAIPLHMIFPRLFTCPTFITPSFKVEFEINLVILFTDSHMVTENFPIILYR